MCGTGAPGAQNQSGAQTAYYRVGERRLGAAGGVRQNKIQQGGEAQAPGRHGFGFCFEVLVLLWGVFRIDVARTARMAIYVQDRYRLFAPEISTKYVFPIFPDCIFISRFH